MNKEDEVDHWKIRHNVLSELFFDVAETLGGHYFDDYASEMVLELIDEISATNGAVKVDRILPQLYLDGVSGDADVLYILRITRDDIWFNVEITMEDTRIRSGFHGCRDPSEVPAFADTAQGVVRYILEWKPGETKYNSKKRAQMVADCVALPTVESEQGEEE